MRKYLDWNKIKVITDNCVDDVFIFVGLKEDWKNTSSLIYAHGLYFTGEPRLRCYSDTLTPVIKIKGELELECWTDSGDDSNNPPSWWKDKTEEDNPSKFFDLMSQIIYTDNAYNTHPFISLYTPGYKLIDLNENRKKFSMEKLPKTIYRLKTYCDFEKCGVEGVKVNINDLKLSGIISAEKWGSDEFINLINFDSVCECTIWFQVESDDDQNIKILQIAVDGIWHKILYNIDSFDNIYDNLYNNHSDYRNWGIHIDGKDEISILDFAYIYDVKYGIFRCSCDNEPLLKYDEEYSNFICPRCGRKYTFADIRRKLTSNVNKGEIK